MGLLTDWQYRKKITISGSSGAGTNYQVLLKVGESSGASGCDFHVEGHSANFPSDTNNSGDLRFTDNDGTTLLSFWVEKVEGTSPNRTAYVWVKIADSLDSSQDVYCYYGNASASNVSSVSDTFIREIDGVVGSWHFDEGSGTTVKDTSGNNHNGTINSATWGDGKFGEALNFDGSNDYVDLGDILDDVFAGADKKFSFSLWVKPASEMTNNSMITKCADSGCSENQRQFLFRLSTDSKPEFLYFCALGTQPFRYRGVLGSTPITDLNKWYHLVMTYDGSVDTNNGLDRVKIYVDGAAESTSLNLSSGTLGDILNGTAHLGIGKNLTSSGTNCGSTYYFHGIIDEVCIYNKALTAEEISDLYNNYGYTTTSYPGKVLVRKRVDPEPSFSSAGSEEITQLTSNLATAWKLLNVYSLYSSWRLLTEEKLNSQWKIFEELTKDTAWQILATKTISRVIEWKLLTTQDMSPAWKLLNTSEANSQWKILDKFGLSLSWKLLTRSDEATAWKILDEFGKGVAWKLLLSKSKDISWQILVSNIVSKLIAWKLVTYFDVDATWKILNVAKRDTSWKSLVSKDKTTAWKLLTSLDTTSAWRLLSEVSRQSSWKLLTTKDKSLSWQILLLYTLSRDLMWKLVTTDDLSSKWRILTGVELDSSWKLFNWLDKDASWKILDKFTAGTVWKILNEKQKDLSWKLFGEEIKELAWSILSEIYSRDVAWKILKSEELDTKWLVGLLYRVSREILLDSQISKEIILESNLNVVVKK